MARHRNPLRKEILHNRLNRKDLLKKLANEKPIPRQTFSFYRYVSIATPHELRDELYREWSLLGVLGRIYIAREGINAQLAVPLENIIEFQKHLQSRKEFENMRFNPGVEESEKSFLKLTIKVKRYIVNDGLGDFVLDEETAVPHLPPLEFNKALAEPETIVVDMRNHYESEVGRFENALCPDVPTFREELPLVAEMLKDKKEEKILIYCTGGIRCEKAGAYLKKQGYKNIFQLEGGVINYVHAVKKAKLPSKFKGKNFVFDERLAERVTDDVLTHCHLCGTPCDIQINCANEGCHVLMVACETCQQKWGGCCSEECHQISLLPEEERRELRRKNPKPGDAWFSKKIRVKHSPQT
ncbi:MAG TPA: rhodanese-related sulfurtransferase [Turneriella sp.]|nr:rhodanese-related sulfurtransferase [Turneriella sp.]